MVDEEQSWAAHVHSQPSRPASATHWLVHVSGMIAVAAALVLLRHEDMFDTIVQSTLFVCGAIATATLAAGWFTGRDANAGFRPRGDDGQLRRCLVKFIGFIATLAAIAIPYLTLPEYANVAYRHFWEALRLAALPVLILALPYIYVTDRRMAEPRDGYWTMGMLVLGRFRQVDHGRLWQHMLGCLVKGFFLPLIFAFACDDLNDFLIGDPTSLKGFKEVYDWSSNVIYLVDVLLAATGYIVSLRLFDTHIRSTEPTPLGWVSALACYMPFYSLIGSSYTRYEVSKDWSEWLPGHPLLFHLWGCVILLLTAIYVWATFAFGCRFSNLTHRGIITNGPYRWTKHPAYIAKNLSWWMISLPFLDVDSVAGTRATLCLLLLNFVYFVRARTEERHLSLDPVYRDYAAWIDRHGLFRGFPRLFPRMLAPLHAAPDPAPHATLSKSSLSRGWE